MIDDFILLPWPHKDLSPNARVHWRDRADQVAKQRKAAYYATKAALSVSARENLMSAGKLAVRVEFFPPDRRARDLDNLMASCKGIFDGIADALGVNDRHFVPTFNLSDHRVDYGAVRVTVEPVA